MIQQSDFSKVNRKSVFFFSSQARSFTLILFLWWQAELSGLLNFVFKWAKVPSQRKHSIVVPIFKQGDPSVPGNYQPISLASCCFKVLEHLSIPASSRASRTMCAHPRVASDGGPMRGWFLSSMCCAQSRPPTRLSPWWTSRQPSTRHGWRQLCFDCSM